MTLRFCKLGFVGVIEHPCHSEERSDEESCVNREGKILRCAQDDAAYLSGDATYLDKPQSVQTGRIRQETHVAKETDLWYNTLPKGGGPWPGRTA